MLKRTILLLALFALCAPQYAIAAKRKREEVKTVIIPVYDTVRVVVTDTLWVKPQPTPKFGTLNPTHTPAEIDSLVEAWVQLHQKQS